MIESYLKWTLRALKSHFWTYVKVTVIKHDALKTEQEVDMSYGLSVREGEENLTLTLPDIEFRSRSHS